MRISHETIYKTIFVQAGGSLEKGLRVHLRSKRKIRKSRSDTPEEHRQGRIMDAVSIRERPAEAEDRAIPGHWEGDLVFGTIDSEVATLVERTSRFLMLVCLESKSAPYVSHALTQHVEMLPTELKSSLTSGQGLRDGGP